MTQAASRSGREGGFTLLELIVVVAIVALAGLAVLPRLSSVAARQEIKAAAARLAAEMRTARADSMRSMRDATVLVDLERRRFAREPDGSLESLPQGIDIGVHEDGLEWAGRARRVRFRSDGTATGGVVVLRDGNSAVRIRVDALSGAVTMSIGR
jgi:general secretion pathway protein H